MLCIDPFASFFAFGCKDNTIHGPIRREPKHDAGGIFVQERAFGLVDYVEKMAQKRVPGSQCIQSAKRLLFSLGWVGGDNKLLNTWSVCWL